MIEEEDLQNFFYDLASCYVKSNSLLDMYVDEIFPDDQYIDDINNFFGEDVCSNISCNQSSKSFLKSVYLSYTKGIFHLSVVGDFWIPTDDDIDILQKAFAKTSLQNKRLVHIKIGSDYNPSEADIEQFKQKFATIKSGVILTRNF